MIRFQFGNDFSAIMRQIVQDKPLSSDARILNVACEYDLLPAFLKGLVSEDQMFGIEINRNIVEANPRIRYCDVDVDAFPFKDDELDLIISSFGIEHFKTDKIFSEAFRTLKSGGRLLFIVPNLLYPMFLVNRMLGEQFAQFYYRRIVRSTYAPHKAYYRFNTAGTIERIAKRIGFKNADILMFGPSNALLYVKRFGFLKSLVNAFEKLITNKVLCRFKPYIIVTLEK